MRRRITSTSERRRRKTVHAARACKKASRTIKNCGGGRRPSTKNVSDKLEALKNLIPGDNNIVKPEQLFQETADYIVRLRTQVFILQKLIHIYGSTTPSSTSTDPPLDNHNVVL